MSEKRSNNIDTLQRITTLEVKQENTEDKIDSLLRNIEKSISSLSKEVQSTKKELEIIYREGMLDLRADLNKSEEKNSRRYQELEKRVEVNEKHREKLAIYLSMGGLTLGIFLTYFKDIVNWIFGK